MCLGSISHIRLTTSGRLKIQSRTRKNSHDYERQYASILLNFFAYIKTGLSPRGAESRLIWRRFHGQLSEGLVVCITWRHNGQRLSVPRRTPPDVRGQTKVLAPAHFNYRFPRNQSAPLLLRASCLRRGGVSFSKLNGAASPPRVGGKRVRLERGATIEGSSDVSWYDSIELTRRNDKSSLRRELMFEPGKAREEIDG